MVKESPKIVITGGLSFIFSYVTEYFVRKGWRVVVIDNCSIGSNPQICDGSFVHHHVDFTTKRGYALAVKENPDYFIHAAAQTDVDYSILHPVETFQNNLLSTVHAFEAARMMPNLKKFLYVSTDEVYGDHAERKSEDDKLDPSNPYSSSKALGSLMRKTYENTYPQLKGKVVELRSCNCFGDRQDTTKIIPQLMKSILKGHEVPLHNGGVGYREFLYVENISPAVELLLLEGEGAYNVAGHGTTVKNLIKKVERILGRTVKTHPAVRVGMDNYYMTDDSKLRALGWKPAYSFVEGLRLTHERMKKSFSREKKLACPHCKAPR